MRSVGGSFPLGRIFGVAVLVHWSWLLVAIFEVKARVGHYTADAWNVAEYLTLFAIVLAHELGHALACRSVGGQAERILLWPLGGIAFVRPPARPGARPSSLRSPSCIDQYGSSPSPCLRGCARWSGFAFPAHSWRCRPLPAAMDMPARNAAERRQSVPSGAAPADSSSTHSRRAPSARDASASTRTLRAPTAAK